MAVITEIIKPRSLPNPSTNPCLNPKIPNHKIKILERPSRNKIIGYVKIILHEK
jgi:hypothetical protein